MKDARVGWAEGCAHRSRWQLRRPDDPESSKAGKPFPCPDHAIQALGLSKGGLCSLVVTWLSPWEMVHHFMEVVVPRPKLKSSHQPNSPYQKPSPPPRECSQHLHSVNNFTGPYGTGFILCPVYEQLRLREAVSSAQSHTARGVSLGSG